MKKSGYIHHRAGAILALALVLATLLVGPTVSGQALPDKTDSEWVLFAPSGFKDGVYRVYYGTGERLAELAVGFEPWEVDREAGYAVLGLDAQAAAELAARGYRLEYDADRTQAHILGPPGYPCYRDVDTLYADMQQIAADYPNLVDVIHYGDSWRKVNNVPPDYGYDLLVLKLSNEHVVLPKPRFFLMANIHARELTTPETAMYFVEYLLSNYGSDADATWMLDYHEIYVVISANPDGRQLVEQGCYQRKNRNDALGSCVLCPSQPGSSSSYGIDLNRNNPYHWGGAGFNPCEQTYQGPSAASEPETYYLNDFVRSIIPDQRAADDVTPAPDDTTGLLISLHSYSNLVLWPWGWTYGSAPNATQLQTLGRKMAYFNKYKPEQSSDLYPTTGDTTDWAYGELGIPAYTFELGERFFQSCGSLSQIVQENLGALLYAAKVPRTPYVTPAGPDALDVEAVPSGVAPGEPVQLSATLDDSRYNHSNGSEPTQNVVAAEYYVDVPPWITTTTPISYPMTAVDGGFDQVVEGVEATVDTGGLSPGRHIIFVRGQDAAGNWGAVSAIFVQVTDPLASPLIEGYVRDANTNAPLDATVVADIFQTDTDPATGYYSLRVISGTYDMHAVSVNHGISRVTGIEAQDYQTIPQDFYLFPVCDIFTDDIESGNAGWTAEGSWSMVVENAHSPSHSWTDSPGSDYGYDWNYSLISPLFDLSDYGGVRLSFWHIYDLQALHDYGYVEYSGDGGASWTQVASYSGQDQSTWMQAEVDLSGLDGAAEARIRFRLRSDLEIQVDGWHLDDILLAGGGPACGGEPLSPTTQFTNNSPVALGDPMRFTNLSTGTLPLDYLWDFGDGLGTSTESDPSYTYLSTGTFTVTLTASNSLGSDSVSHPVVVEPFQCISLTGVTIAGETSGYPGVYTFSTSYRPAGATPPISYTWDDGGSAGTSVRDLGVGAHTLLVTATNCLTRSVTASYTIEVQPAPVCTDVTGVTLSQVTSGTVYVGDEVAFEANLTPDEAAKPYSYTVDYGDGAVFSASDSADPLSLSHSYAATGTYPVQIEVWNCDMTQPVTDGLTLTVGAPEVCKPLTEVALSLLTPGTLYLGAELTLGADLAPDEASKPYSYTVNYGDGTALLPSTGSQDPLLFSHTYAAVGNYTVVVSAWNCDMSVPVSDTLPVVVVAGFHQLYLPIVIKNG